MSTVPASGPGSSTPAIAATIQLSFTGAARSKTFGAPGAGDAPEHR